MTRRIDIPVLVVGAGPVGLGVGLELGWRGIDCLLIEREAHRETAINLHPRAAAVTPRTMEFCRRWGVARAVHDSGFPKDLPNNIVYCTDLQGPTVLVQEFPAINDRPPLAVSPELRERCPQIWFDPTLERGLAQYPSVELKRPWQLDRFEDRGDHVMAWVTDLSTDEAIEIRAKYLVACDGPTSPIREALGIATTGPGLLSYSLNAILDIPDFLSWHDKGPAERYMFLDPRGVWAELTVIDGRDRWRLGYAGSTQSEDSGGVDVDAIVRKVLGPDVPFNIVALSPWRRRESIASQFVKGRVLLAGDAAHTIPPNLGMGMNTGMGDAMDLAWKLEALLKGWGGPRLLETYDAERRPVAEHNAAVSTATYRRWMSSTDHYRDIGEPGDKGVQARRKSAEHIEQTLGEGWDTLGFQIGYRYDASPVVVPDGTPAPPPGRNLRDFTPTARPGAYAPHAWLPDGRSLLDVFGKGYVLLRFDPAVKVDALRAAAEVRAVPLTVFDCEETSIAGLYERKLVLVRPDAHIVWRADQLPEDSLALIDTVRGA